MQISKILSVVIKRGLHCVFCGKIQFNCFFIQKLQYFGKFYDENQICYFFNELLKVERTNRSSYIFNFVEKKNKEGFFSITFKS